MPIGTTEIIIIVLILLLLFGGKKIPELMRGLGSGVKEFKKATNVEEETAADTRKNYDRPQIDDRRHDDRRLEEPSPERRYEDRRSEGEQRSEVR
jgi:sec-independent protein translocase protein TatA